MNNHSLQNTEEEPIALGSTPAAPAAHTRYLSSPAGATLHGKTQGFLPRLSPQKKSPCRIHAAMTMRFATSGSQPASLDAHGNTKRQRSCSHYTAICNQRVKKRIELRTHEQPLIAEHRGGTNRAWFDPSRTRRTHEVPFIAGRSHFTRKNTRFPAPAFPPKQSPCHIHAAMTMRFATSGSQPASLDAHGNTKRQRSCSHYTAICNQRVKKRIELRTHEQPLIAEHRGGTNRAWFDPSRTRRTHEVPFIAGRSHFTRKNTRFLAPGFPQKTKPMSHPCSHYNAFCNFRFQCKVTHHPSLSIVSHFSV